MSKCLIKVWHHPHQTGVSLIWPSKTKGYIHIVPYAGNEDTVLPSLVYEKIENTRT